MIVIWNLSVNNCSTAYIQHGDCVQVLNLCFKHVYPDILSVQLAILAVIRDLSAKDKFVIQSGISKQKIYISAVMCLLYRRNWRSR